MKRLTILLAAATLAGATNLASAQDIKIAHVYDKTGPLEAYAKQTQAGLMLGLEYATSGTMTVLGRKIVVIEKDDQLKPDVGKALLAQAYGDDKVDLAIARARSSLLSSLTAAFERELPDIAAATGELAQSLQRLKKISEVIDAVAGVLGVIEKIIALGR